MMVHSANAKKCGILNLTSVKFNMLKKLGHTGLANPTLFGSVKNGERDTRARVYPEAGGAGMFASRSKHLKTCRRREVQSLSHRARRLLARRWWSVRGLSRHVLVRPRNGGLRQGGIVRSEMGLGNGGLPLPGPVGVRVWVPIRIFRRRRHPQGRRTPSRRMPAIRGNPCSAVRIVAAPPLLAT